MSTALRPRDERVDSAATAAHGIRVEWGGCDLLRLVDGPKRLCLLRRRHREDRAPFHVRWRSGVAGSELPFVVWLDRLPRPRSRAALWLRVITRLHSHGLIDDASLERAVAASTDRPDAAVAEVTQTLSAASRRLVLVVDGVRGEPEDDEIWLEVCNDILALMQGSDALRCVIASDAPTVLDDAIVTGSVPGVILGDAGPHEQRSAPALSRREREVLSALIVTGNRAELASMLFVSENTVKTHLRSLYQKLGVRSRSEALERARASGLTAIDRAR